MSTEDARDGKTVVVRLDRGEEIVGGLLDVLRKHQAQGAVVVTGLGACEKAEIGYFDPVHKKYDKQLLEKSHEILALSGIVARAPEGTYQPHFHVVLGASDHSAVGGHLFSARVSVLAEVVLELIALPQMRREPESAFGLTSLRLS